jgi:hypothetical protein
MVNFQTADGIIVSERCRRRQSGENGGDKECGPGHFSLLTMQRALA